MHSFMKGQIYSMKKRLYPDFRFRSVNDIPGDFFKRNGIKYVICDIDNTLIDDNEPEPDERAFAFIERLKKEGIELCLVSNNSRERVEAFNRQLGLNAVHRARKPLSMKIKRAMRAMGAEPENTALIGDQLFTDIAGGNGAGLKTVLVTPINPGKETSFFKVKRFFERLVMKDMEILSDDTREGSK